MKRKILSLLLILTLLAACGTTVFAAAPVYEDNELPIIPIDGGTSTPIGDSGLSCSLGSNGTLTIRGTGVMPELAEDERPWASQLRSIRALVVESGVASICDGAFAGCTALETVSLPDSLRAIGEKAFSGCEKLATVSLPNGVERIGENAFAGTGFAADNTKNGLLYAGKWLLHADSAITMVDLKSDTVGIADRAFAGCTKFKTLLLPDSIQFVGKDVLQDSAYAAEDAHWKNDLLYLGNWVIAARENPEKAELQKNTVGIADSVFDGCAALKTFTVADGALRRIGVRSFAGCTGLTGVPIPDGLTGIGAEAFAGCTALTEVVLPATVRSVGDNAFDGCTALEKITVYNDGIALGTERGTLGIPGKGNTLVRGRKSSAAQTFAAKSPAYDFEELSASDICGTHNWGDWTVKTAPTRTSDGEIEIRCLHCGTPDNETLPKLDATNYDIEQLVKPTCTTEGKGKYTWKTKSFGTFSFEATLDRAAHSYSSFTEKQAPTLTVEGLLEGTCSVCKQTALFSLPKLNTIDYTYSEVTKATCTAAGTGRYTLKNTATYGSRQYDITIAALGHLDANKDGKCDRCGTKLDTSSTSPDTGAASLLPILLPILLGLFGTTVSIRKLKA